MDDGINALTHILVFVEDVEAPETEFHIQLSDALTLEWLPGGAEATASPKQVLWAQ